MNHNVAERALEQAQYILDNSNAEDQAKTAGRVLLGRLWEVNAARDAGANPAIATRVAKLIGKSADGIQPEVNTNVLGDHKARAILAVNLVVKAAAMAVEGVPGTAAAFDFAARLLKNRTRVVDERYAQAA